MSLYILTCAAGVYAIYITCGTFEVSRDYGIYSKEKFSKSKLQITIEGFTFECSDIVHNATKNNFWSVH